MFRSNTRELESIIAEARLVSLNMKHGFILGSHAFIAMHRTDCLAQKYLQKVIITSFVENLQATYPPVSLLEETDDVPLTLEMELLIKHADWFAEKTNKKYTDSVHLLLAMLSYNNSVSELIQKTGLIFEDVVLTNFSQAIVKRPPQLNLPVVKRYSRLIKFLLNKEWIKKRVEEIHNYAYTCFQFGYYDQCIQVCNAGQSLSASYESFKILAACSYELLRDFENAKTAFINLIQEYPQRNEYAISLAFILDEMGKYDSAGPILDELLLKNPDDETILNNKGFNLCNIGKYEESIFYFEKAIKLKPDFAYPWDNLGFAKFKLGYTDEALSLIDKSLALDKGNAYAYKSKGVIFLSLDNKIEAKENLNLALKFGYTSKYGDEALKLLEGLM